MFKNVNLINYYKIHNRKTVTLSLYFWKAINSFKMVYLKTLLLRINFDDHFLQPITALYSEVKAQTKVNGV